MDRFLLQFPVSSQIASVGEFFAVNLLISIFNTTFINWEIEYKYSSGLEKNFKMFVIKSNMRL